MRVLYKGWSKRPLLCVYQPMHLYSDAPVHNFWNMNKLWSLPLLYWCLAFLVFVLFCSFSQPNPLILHFCFLFCFVSWLSLILPLLTPWLPDLPYSVSEWVLYFPSLSYPAYCLFPNLAETKSMKKTLSHLAAWRNNEMPTSTRLEDI